MKLCVPFYIISTLTILIISVNANSQITRGSIQGEIYISNDWYIDEIDIYRAVFRSIDNGEHLTLQYSNTNPPQTGEMGVNKLMVHYITSGIMNYGQVLTMVAIGSFWKTLYFQNILVANWVE